jgi:hypothetical protein
VLTAASAVAAGAADGLIESRHGTLIVSVLTRDALVVCADRRRLGLGPGGREDNVRKVFAVGRNALAAASGYTYFVKSAPQGPIVLDVAAVLSRCAGASPRRALLAHAAAAVPVCLERAAADFFSDVPEGSWPWPVGPLFAVGVFGVAEGRVWLMELEARFDHVPPVRLTVSAHLTRDYRRIVRLQGAGLDGLGLLPDAKTPVWDALRKDALVARILRASDDDPVRDLLAAEDGVRLGRALVEGVSRTSTALGLEDVGPDADCAVLPVASPLR